MVCSDGAHVPLLPQLRPLAESSDHALLAVAITVLVEIILNDF